MTFFIVTPGAESANVGESHGETIMTEQILCRPERDECATFVQRYCAAIIDTAAVLILLNIAGIFSLMVITDVSHMAIAMVCQLLMVLLYFSLFESSALSATPGKLAMKLQVLRDDGGKITLRDVFWRLAVACMPLAVVPSIAYSYTQFVPGDSSAAQAVVFTIICLGFIYSLGYVMTLFTPMRQTLLDQMTKRVVVRKRSRESHVPVLSSQSVTDSAH